MTDRALETAEAERLARRAAELGKDDAVALSSAALTLAYVVGDVEGGAALLDRARVINPNLALAWENSSWVKGWIGEPESAIECATQAIRLSPLDPWLCNYFAALAYGNFFAGRYDEASSWGERALRENPHYQPALRATAASHALTGRLAEAHKVVAHLRQLDPALRVSSLKDLVPIRRPDDRARLEEGLRKAGLPEK